MKVYHVHDERSIVGTLAIEWSKDGDLSYSWAVKAPNDKFDRKLGAKIATERLKAGRCTHAGKFDTVVYYDAFDQIFCHVVENSQVPNRLRKAVSNRCIRPLKF